MCRIVDDFGTWSPSQHRGRPSGVRFHFSRRMADSVRFLSQLSGRHNNLHFQVSETATESQEKDTEANHNHDAL